MRIRQRHLPGSLFALIALLGQAASPCVAAMWELEARPDNAGFVTALSMVEDFRPSFPQAPFSREFPSLQGVPLGGDGNGVANPGERLRLIIQARNISGVAMRSCSAFLETETPLPGLALEVTELPFDATPSGARTTCSEDAGFWLFLADDLQAGDYPLRLRLVDGEQGEEIKRVTLRVEAAPRVELVALTVDDDRPGHSDGNGDGIAQPGEVLELRARLANRGDRPIEAGDYEDLRLELHVPSGWELQSGAAVFARLPAQEECESPETLIVRVSRVRRVGPVTLAATLEGAMQGRVRYRPAFALEIPAEPGPPRVLDRRMVEARPGLCVLRCAQLSETTRVLLDGMPTPVMLRDDEIAFFLPPPLSQSDPPLETLHVRLIEDSTDQSAETTLRFEHLAQEIRVVENFERGLGLFTAQIDADPAETRWRAMPGMAADGALAARAVLPEVEHYGAHARAVMASSWLGVSWLVEGLLRLSWAQRGDARHDRLRIFWQFDGSAQRKLAFESPEEPTPDYAVITRPLPPHARTMRLSAEFRSDGSDQGEGAFLDAIEVLSEHPLISAVYRLRSPSKTTLLGVHLKEARAPVTFSLDGRELPGVEEEHGRWRLHLDDGAPLSEVARLDFRDARGVLGAPVRFRLADLEEHAPLSSMFGESLAPFEVVTTGPGRARWTTDGDEYGAWARCIAPESDGYDDYAESSLCWTVRDLTDLSEALLSFECRLELEAEADALFVEVHSTQAPDWLPLWDSRKQASFEGIERVAVKLNDRGFAPQALRFRFRSDHSRTGRGVFLRNIRVDEAGSRR